jgi:hypothetical protein
MKGISVRADHGAADREWRRSFVRASTGIVLAKLLQRTGHAAEILRSNWSNDRVAAEIIQRGPVSPTTQDDYPGSSVSRLMLLAPKSAAARLFALATTVDLKGIDSFSFPLPTNFADASFVAEGAAIPVRQGVFAGMNVGPTCKLAMLASLSGELQNASGGIAETIISHTLEVAVGRGLDAVLLSDDPPSDSAPGGLLHNVTPITAAAGGGSTAMSADLVALVAAIASAGISTDNVVFVAAAAQAITLKLSAGPHFDYRVIGANITPGTIIAVAVAGLVIAGDGSVPQIDISTQTVLHHADPASQISIPGVPPDPNVISTPTISMYQNDLVALRAIVRITWVAAPNAVQVVNNVTW